jgi:MerR family mercuric resistance operon transcriptional regulator
MRQGHTRVTGLRRVDLARATGCNIEAIRYYENIGLMPEPPRALNGYRVYDGTHVSRLGFVMRARDLGFSLEQVREILTLVDGGMQTCGEVSSLAQVHLDDVREKISDLQRIEGVLTDTVARCTGGDVPQCAVIDALIPLTE